MSLADMLRGLIALSEEELDNLKAESESDEEYNEELEDDDATSS